MTNVSGPDGFLSDEVHQASGMVAAQLDISPADGLQMLRMRARASDTSVAYISGAVLRGEIRFDD